MNLGLDLSLMENPLEQPRPGNPLEQPRPENPLKRPRTEKQIEAIKSARDQIQDWIVFYAETNQLAIRTDIPVFPYLKNITSTIARKKLTAYYILLEILDTMCGVDIIDRDKEDGRPTLVKIIRYEICQEYLKRYYYFNSTKAHTAMYSIDVPFVSIMFNPASRPQYVCDKPGTMNLVNGSILVAHTDKTPGQSARKIFDISQMQHFYSISKDIATWPRSEPISRLPDSDQKGLFITTYNTTSKRIHTAQGATHVIRQDEQQISEILCNSFNTALFTNFPNIYIISFTPPLPHLQITIPQYPYLTTLMIWNRNIGRKLSFMIDLEILIAKGALHVLSRQYDPKNMLAIHAYSPKSLLIVNERECAAVLQPYCSPENHLNAHYYDFTCWHPSRQNPFDNMITWVNDSQDNIKNGNFIMAQDYNDKPKHWIVLNHLYAYFAFASNSTSMQQIGGGGGAGAPSSSSSLSRIMPPPSHPAQLSGLFIQNAQPP